LISFAAIFLIVSKLVLYDYQAENLCGASDILLSKTVEWLSGAAYTPEHYPARCASLIASSLATLERRKATIYGGLAGDRRAAPTVTKSVVPEPAGGPVAPRNDLLTPDLIHHLNPFMHSDIFLDTDFWSSFMNNLSYDSREHVAFSLRDVALD